MRPAGFFFCLFFSSIGVHSQPVLRWAADPNSNAPYTFYAPGKSLAGFEYEIINAIARRLGRHAEFVQNDWSGLIPGLHRGLYDCVICGIEITPDKANEVSFSDPYYFTFEQFVGRRGTTPITSLEELRGRKIGTLDQTAAVRMLEATPGVVVKTYDQEVSAYQDIVNERLYGVLLDYPIAKYYAAPNPLLELSGPPFGRIAYGIAVDKGNLALQQEIDGALRELIADGELRDILSRWGLWTSTVAQEFGQSVKPSTDGNRVSSFRGLRIPKRKLMVKASKLRCCRAASSARRPPHVGRVSRLHDGGHAGRISACCLQGVRTAACALVRHDLYRSHARHSSPDSAPLHLLRAAKRWPFACRRLLPACLDSA